MEGTSSCINQHADCWLLPGCLSPPPPPIRKTNYGSASNTHTHTHTHTHQHTHTYIYLSPVCKTCLMNFNTNTPAQANTCTHPCMYVCHGLVHLCLGKLKHYVRHTRTSTERMHTRIATHSQLNTTLCHVHTHSHTRAHTHSHTFHSWRIGRFLRAPGPTGKMSGQT